MSSPRRSALLAAACALATLWAGACGSDDEEPDRASGKTHAATTESTTSATTPTTTTTERTTTERKAKRRKQRRERRKAADKPATTESQPAPTPEPEPKPEPQPQPEPPQPKVLAIEESATLHLVRRKGITWVQQGAVRGTLSGRMLLEATVGGPGVTATFTVSLADGTLRGRGSAKVRPDGSVAHFNGTASVTGGTGTYAKATARGLRFTGTVASDGSRSTVKLSGRLTY